MSQNTRSADRRARIELLRVRAAVEREALVDQAAEAARALRPGQLLRSALSGLGGGSDGSDSSDGSKKGSLLAQVIRIVSRHPLLTSTLPSLLLSRLGGRRIVSAATLGLTGWQLYKAWRGARKSKAQAEVQVQAEIEAASAGHKT